MTLPLAPASISELVEMVRSTPRLLPFGAGTKPRLATTNNGAAKISLTGLSGILEYEPSEFTFTALAGTPVREIAAALAERGQYLPFDPLLVEGGATLGGTLAAGLSGPGRMRFGGLRDFILGTRFVDGSGRLLFLGGKVVKNAAGFDLPKFFVGSLGRFGVLAELTFKVFPQPPSRLTLKLKTENLAGAARILIEASSSRWEAEALDIPAGVNAVYLRLGGPQKALGDLAKEILERWPGEVLTASEAGAFWSDVVEFRWAHDQDILVKLALTPEQITSLDDAMAGLDGRVHISAGGNMAFISLASSTEANRLDERLKKIGLSGLMLRGKGALWLGKHSRTAILDAVKRALDPDNRFPSLDD